MHLRSKVTNKKFDPHVNIKGLHNCWIFKPHLTAILKHLHFKPITSQGSEFLVLTCSHFSSQFHSGLPLRSLMPLVVYSWKLLIYWMLVIYSVLKCPLLEKSYTCIFLLPSCHKITLNFRILFSQKNTDVLEHQSHLSFDSFW